MKKKGKKVLLVIFSFIIFNVNTTISDQKTWNWFEAQQYCSNTNDTLKAVGVTPNSLEHWTGFYRRYSPWIKLLGCFDSEVVNKQRTFHFYFNFSSAGLCQEICASVNSTLFGIQLEKCVCFENPIFAETISPDQCNITCNDVGDEVRIKFSECGGPNAYTLYKSEDDGDNNGAACLAINCGTIKKFSLSSDCSESYHGACAYKEYVGCFKDQPNRTLSMKSIGSFYMTLEYCRNFCNDTLWS
ncbi:uncharacterized protein LOC134263491 isoform X2 [Saccostrea cucullata]|uniref:uncharacterized protein LOC134263491 isoform X2 n=1 Tax=Saccostrea cuccullata TaxID=36930 RepID=UPI002ED09995